MTTDQAATSPRPLSVVFDFWRRTLADAALSVPENGPRMTAVAADIIGGMLPPSVVAALRAEMLKQHPAPVLAESAPLDVLLCPSVLSPSESHGSHFAKGSRGLYIPLIVPARLMPDGALRPPEPLNGPSARRPWFARSVLDPAFDDGRPLPVVGTMADFDAARSKLSADLAGTRVVHDPATGAPSAWTAYWTAMTAFCKAVTAHDPTRIMVEGYDLQAPLILGTASLPNPTHRFMSLLEELSSRGSSNSRLKVPLLEAFLGSTLGLPSPLAHPPQTGTTPFSRHLGHLDCRHGMAPSQRHALSLALSTPLSRATPITGPPGTGKTTLLRGIVASLYVEAALAKADRPPLILAVSSNNRALNNISNAFLLSEDTPPAKPGPLPDPSLAPTSIATRWLPPLDTPGAPRLGYSLWLPSRTRQYDMPGFARAIKNGHIWTGDQTARETAPYVERASAHFKDCFRRSSYAPPPPPSNSALSPPDLSDVISALHEAIVFASRLLARTTVALPSIRRVCLGERPRDLDQAIADMAAKHRAIEDLRCRAYVDCTSRVQAAAAAVADAARRHSERPVPASWLDADTMVSARSIAGTRSSWLRLLDEQGTMEREHREERCSEREEVSVLERLAETEPRRPFATLSAALDETHVAFPDSTTPTHPDATDPATGEALIEAVESYLDRTVRYRLWHLACRYWEARWLVETRDLVVTAGRASKSSDRRKSPPPPQAPDTRDDVLNRLGRWSKLTPCLVSTWHQALAVLEGQEKGSSNWHGRLTDAVDLLLCDEAGQTPPEIGVTGLAIAKRAVLIGDTSQIPPVATSTEGADRTTLKLSTARKPNRPLSPPVLYDQLADGGLLPSTGSLMAAGLSAHQADPATRPVESPVLREQWRSVPAICDLVSDIAYPERLQPQRHPLSDRPWPPVGLVEVLGYSQRGQSGHFNEIEVRCLTAWLKANLPTLHNAYPGQPLEKIVGILAPYRDQVATIRRMLADEGIRGTKDPITIGSVHSLQGDERPVILLSMTGTTEWSLKFASTRSMINVAISRAKDHVIIFGDTSTWDTKPDTPLGKLAAYFRGDESRKILFDHHPPAGSAPSGPVVRNVDIRRPLNTLEQHRAALANALDYARRRVVIVSPWLTSPPIIADHICERINAATARGVEVLIYHNKRLTLDQTNGPKGLSLLEATAAAIFSCNIHRKEIAVDDDEHFYGSFNWFSAVRDSRSHLSYIEGTKHTIGIRAVEDIADLLSAVSKATPHSSGNTPAP